MVANLDLGLKIQATLSLTIFDKLFMVIIEADIFPILATLPLITQVNMAYFV